MGKWISTQLLLLLIILGAHATTATRLADVSALLALKTGWGNPSSLTSWVNDPCTSGWVGVTCGPLGADVTVTALSIPGLNLAGPISSQIGNLTGLVLLNLGGNPITGPIPKELGSLTALQYLYINSTQVSGTLPDGLGALVQLIELRLDGNQLSGNLPYDLTQLTRIQTMQFQDNAFNGSIPYQFGGLVALKGLFMQNNNFTGQLPNSFAQSPNLEILALFNNSLQGNLPQEFGSLRKLRGLYLQSNQMTGSIPAAIANCIALVELFLNDNEISGPIPPAVFQMPALTSLVLSNNQFTGTLPPTVGPLLTALLVDNNTMTGNIPASYGAIPTFRYTPNDFCSYQIGFVCQGGGCLKNPGPQCLAQAPAPAPVAAGLAPIIAPAPLNTSIPPNPSVPLNTSVPVTTTSPVILPVPVATPVVTPIATPAPTPTATPAPTPAPLKCGAGQVVSSLSGIPLCVSPMQASFRLADKNLPDWTPDFQTSFLNDLASTIGLSPQQINVTRVAQGSILLNTDFFPTSGTALDNQTVAGIQSKLVGNNLQLALDNSKYGNVFVTDLVSPATGGIVTLAPTVPPPDSKGSSGLSGAAIGGIVAAVVVFLIALCIAGYLLFTRRSGHDGRGRQDPLSPSADYGEKSHTEVHVYDSPGATYESKAAPAPAPAYATTTPVPPPKPFIPPQETFTPRAAATSARSPSTKSMNPPSPVATPPLDLAPPPGRSPARSPSVKSPVPVLASPTSEAFSTPLTPKKSPSFLFSRRKKESTPPALELAPAVGGLAAATRSQLVVNIAARNFSLRELQTATNNFARGNLVGEGGLGRVYRAGMEEKEFAVKRLDQKVGESEEQFLREVAVLAELHHAHVVELVGYCSEGTNRILVHEFVPNRTLQDHLHGDKETGRKPGTPITWNARMKIALGMARGLEYLHARSPPLAHSCFKTSNVLLDHDLAPKISDAGVARLFPQGADKQLSTQMLGNFAYAAPEYSMTGEHTAKGDVYSFGVVLLELMTGRRPLDSSRPRYEQSLVRWATPMLHSLERLQEMVDPELEGIFPSKSLLKFAEIVSECVQPEAEFRPAMAEVVEQLQTHLVPFAGFNARSLRRAGSQNSLASPLRSPSMPTVPMYSRSPSYYDHRGDDDE